MEKSKLYARIWRWHFYAGLLVTPFMLTLAVTGSIYLFKPQLDPLVYPQLLKVPPSANALADSEIVQKAKTAYPSAIVESYFAPATPDSSAAIGMSDLGEKFNVYVNPHDGQVLGMRDEASYYQNVVKKIHGELLIGTIGDRLVETVACWGLILICSGLYLWWPRGQKFWGVWWPRWNGGSRVFWRDLHACLGVYTAILISFLIITGLPWTGFWGERYAKVWNSFPPHAFASTPESTMLTAELNKGQEQMVPWAAETAPLPTSAHVHEKSVKSASANQISIDRITEIARKENLPGGYKIAYPHDEMGVFTLSSFPGDPRLERTIHIDQYSGNVIEEVSYANYNLFAKTVEYGISLHQGLVFGWLNQLLALIACLALIGLCISGTVMWWRRRPEGSLGAPRKVEGRSPLVILAIMGIFAVALPMVGLSLIIVLVADFAVTNISA